MRSVLAALAIVLSLSTEGVAAAPPVIDLYAQLPATALVALSPSGQRIAYVTTSGATRQLVIRTVDGPALQTTDLGDDIPCAVDWAGEDHVVFQVSLTEIAASGRGLAGGKWRPYETFRAFSINLATKQTLVLFKFSTDVLPAETGYYGARNADGHWYGYFGAIPRRINRDINHTTIIQEALYRVDLDSGDYNRLVMASGWAIAGDGTVAAHGSYDPFGQRWTLGAGAEGHQFLSIDDSFYESDLLGLGRRPDTVLVRRWDRADGALWEQPLSDGAAVNLAEDPATAPIYNADGLLIGLLREGDRRQVQLFDPAQQKKLDAVVQAFAPSVAEFVTASSRFDRIVVFASAPDDAGTYYVVDIAAQKVVPIGKTYPGLDRIAPTRILTYKAGDGTDLQGVLTIPPGAEVKARALVVLPHDGPNVRDHLDFNWLAQAFASHGYVVFQPNYRGSSGFGLAFRNAGFGQLGRKAETDISDGIAELARQAVVDPKRVCIVGAGFGGYAALAGVTLQHGLYRCAAAINGIADLPGQLGWGVDRMGELGPNIRAYERRLGASSSADGSIAAFSPASLADKADAPVLLLWGSDDVLVPPSQGETMARALEKAGKPVKQVVLKNEDHGLSHEATRRQLLAELVEFVQQNDPPG